MVKPAKIDFIPLNFNWVALNPNPIGVLYFVGGAFFGSFPTFFYRYLLGELFHLGYTIVAIPYRFTFQHWSVAINLVQDQVTLRQALINEAMHYGYGHEAYQQDPEDDASNYIWLGHSLGCKYIALIELLTDLEKQIEKQGCVQSQAVSSFLGTCIPPQEQRNLQLALAYTDLSSISISGHQSILMAPAIEGIEGAIPFLRMPQLSSVKKLLNNIGIKVEPSQCETFCQILQSQLFTLTRLIYFDEDTRIADPTVSWLQQNLGKQLVQEKKLSGRHLAPLGWLKGNSDIVQVIKSFLSQ